MKRKALSLLLAICLVAGMLPSVTLAAEQQTAAEQPATEKVTVTLHDGITWEAKPNECYYAATSTAGAVTDLGKQDKEPAGWNIKLDNTKAVAELTFRGAVIKLAKTLSSGKTALEAKGNGALKIIADGASFIETGNSHVITLRMGGGTTITSLNNSLLKFAHINPNNHYCLRVLEGGLTLDHANLSVLNQNAHYAAYPAISVTGNMEVKGGTLAVAAEGTMSCGIKVSGKLDILEGAAVTVTKSSNGDLAAPRYTMYGISATALHFNGGKLTVTDAAPYQYGVYKGQADGQKLYSLTLYKSGSSADYLVPTLTAAAGDKMEVTIDGTILQGSLAGVQKLAESRSISIQYICDDHKYTNNADADCNKCGEIREISGTEPDIEPEPEKTPFYMVNWTSRDVADRVLPEYVASMPRMAWEGIKEGETKITVSLVGSGTTDIRLMAQMLKNEFDSMPEGTRYLNFPLSIEANVEHMIYLDKTVAMFKAWIEEFFTEYKRIGGKIDGLILDTEYSEIGAHYIHKAYNEKTTEIDEEEGTTITLRPNKNIYNDIVNDPRYATEVRPYLVERGFKFGTPSGYQSEIYPISVKFTPEYYIWDAVMRDRMCKYLNEAYSPFMKLYPHADISNYKFSGGKMWDESTGYRGGSIDGGNTMYAGNTANVTFYLRRPLAVVRETDEVYKTPITYNQAVYGRTPFHCFLMETNAFKDMYASSDNKRINAWITGFNYGTATSPEYGLNYSPYYAETLFHIGLLDPEPFIGYVIGPRDTDNEGDGYNYDDVMKNISDVMKELNRLVGFKDREPIFVQRNWNSNFVLSGMYADGRNVWRITPNTCQGTSLEEFLVKDKAPTFTVNGETIIFPQGRIIADGDVHVTGTCGYWIETPANVKPVIVTDADRYEKYPAYEENFEVYDAGTIFSATTAQYENAWTVSGTGTTTITSHNGSNALAWSGTKTITNTKIPANVTAGDSYAKQQVWEVTVTIPSSGTLNVLSCGGSDAGVQISGTGVYYNGSTQFATVTKGQTYIISRELDFRNANAFTCTYTVRKTDGTIVGQKAGVAMTQVSLPVKSITFSGTNVSGAYLDNYRLRAIGVTTELRLYEADTGMHISDVTAATKEAAVYRVSWYNATGDYQIAKVYNNGQLIQTIEMPSGADSYVTGHIASGSKITVTVEKGTAPTPPDYDEVGVAGDVNGDNEVTDADAVYLLYATFYPEKYPLHQTADYNGDGEVSDADAIYLLYATFYPEKYPLTRVR